MNFLRGIIKSPTLHEANYPDQINIKSGSLASDTICQVMVSCDIGKSIRKLLHDHLKSAGDEYVTNLKSDEIKGKVVGATDVQKMYGLTNDIKMYIKTAESAQKSYEAKIAREILVPNGGFDCLVSVKNSTDESGQDTKRLPGKIIKLLPKNDTIVVNVTVYEKKDKKSNATKAIDLKDQSIDFNKLCIGGDKAIEPGKNCKIDEWNTQVVVGNQQPAQSGGKKKKQRGGSTNVDSSDNICE